MERKPRLLALLVILSTVTILIAAMLQMRQAGQVDERRLDWRDSVANHAFGIERQFLIFRGELAALLATPGRAVPIDRVGLRYEVMVSRVVLLRNSASLHGLVRRPEHAALMPQLDALVERGDALMARKTVPRTEAEALLAQMNAMLPDVQSYTFAGSSVTSTLIEDQFSAIHAQTVAIAVLAILQLLLVAVAVRALWTRHGRQRAQLELLTEELRDAKVAAEAASRTKSQFLANMSHELRTPFQGVLGMLQILERGRLSVSQRELIQTVRESASHLLVVLNEILDISAIEAGRIVLHESPLELPRLCHEVAGLMRLQAEARGLELSFDPGPAMPSWVLGDGTRIKQILFNLLSNAIKFTPRGQVRLRLEHSRRPDGRLAVNLIVQDTGIGMDDETLRGLFRRFQPGDSELSRRFSGTGLGLEISRTLARLMGGDLTADSRLGAGSSLQLWLPLAPTAAPLEAVDLAPTIPSQRLHVLVADDHPVNRRYLGLVLGSLGHEATLCANGEEALRAVRAEAFDAVLMDVHMPVMDGLAATRAIRALGGAHLTLPVLALTADVMGDARAHAMAAGVTTFLAKPVGIDELASALASLPGERASAGAAPGEPALRCLSDRYEELAARLPKVQLRELVASFFADDSAAFAQLGTALTHGSHEGVREAAHKFKGSASMLGFARLARAAESAEGWARAQGSADRTATLAEALSRAWEETRLQLAGRIGSDADASLPGLAATA